MKSHTSLPPRKAPPVVTCVLPPPGEPSPTARDRADPGVFTDLARSIAAARPELAVCMNPATPRLLYARPGTDLRQPHDRFLQPSRPLVDSTTARWRLRGLVSAWCDHDAVLAQPAAQRAMAQLTHCATLPLDLGLSVGRLRGALETLSALLDPASPWARLARLPNLPGLVSEHLGTDDPEERPNLRAVARELMQALAHPADEIDLGVYEWEDVESFVEIGGMQAFLNARLAIAPAVTSLVLCSGLEVVPDFVSRFSSLQELVLPFYDSNILDLQGLDALESVCLSGEVPDLYAVSMPAGRGVRLEDDMGLPVALEPAPADPTDR